MTGRVSGIEGLCDQWTAKELKELAGQYNFVWLGNQMDGQMSQIISMLYEVQGATNGEAMSQCIYGILCGQWMTNVVARSQ